MTLPANGNMTRSQIETEFGLPSTARWPTDFLGKGGAPAARPLKWSDFHGLSNTPLFDVAPGNYSQANDYSCSFTINCSQSVVWTYTGGPVGAGSHNFVSPSPSGSVSSSWSAETDAYQVTPAGQFPSFDDPYTSNSASFTVSCVIAGVTYTWHIRIVANAPGT